MLLFTDQTVLCFNAKRKKKLGVLVTIIFHISEESSEIITVLLSPRRLRRQRAGRGGGSLIDEDGEVIKGPETRTMAEDAQAGG